MGKKYSLTSLESFSPEDQTRAPVLALPLLALTLASAAWFVNAGLESRAQGDLALAGKLLAIQERDSPPPAFELESFEGEKVSLKGLGKRVVFLNFWATWCPPCVEEMPSMERLYNKLKTESDFEMVAITVDKQWDEVRRFFRTYRPGFEILIDPDSSIASQYGSSVYPETYVIVDGRVRAFIEGPRDWDTWYAEAYLRSLIRGADGANLARAN
jgi:thiol-disulfide isomerase/thioredoxin